MPFCVRAKREQSLAVARPGLDHPSRWTFWDADAARGRVTGCPGDREVSGSRYVSTSSGGANWPSASPWPDCTATYV